MNRTLKLTLMLALAAGIALAGPWAGPAARAAGEEIAAAASAGAPIANEEEAVARARQLPFVTEGMELQQAISWDSPAGVNWNVNLQHSNPDENGIMTSVDVALSAADGRVRSLSLSYTQPGISLGVWGSEKPDTPAEVDFSQAIVIAQAFLDSLHWGIDAQWMLDPYPESAYSTRFDNRGLHKVRFDQSVNGIRYPDGQFTVWVSPGGEIVSYRMNWSEMEFADPASVISADEAKAIFLDRSEPVMSVMSRQSVMPVEADRVIYSLWQLHLDAASGTFPQSRNYNPHPQSGNLQPIAPPSGIAPSFTGDRLLSEEEAKQAAIRYVWEDAPDFAGQLAVSSILYLEGASIPQYQIRFDRIVNGIAIEDQYVEASIHAYNGTLLSMNSISLGVDSNTLPDVQAPALGKEQAKRLLLSLYEVELEYYWAGVGRAELSYSLRLNPETIVDYFGWGPVLDAGSGQWVSKFGGSPVDVPVAAGSAWVDALAASPERIQYGVALVLDGQLLPLTHEPVIREGSTLVPFRELLESLQAEVLWDGARRKVVAAKGNTRLELTLDDKTAFINGTAYQLEVPAQLVGDSTYVPARFIAEAFDAAVDWDGPSRLAIIRTDRSAPLPSAEELAQFRLEAERNWETEHWPQAAK